MSVTDGSRLDDVLPTIDDNCPEGRLWMLVSHSQAHELSVGRVPADLRETARFLADETFEDLRKNAAKPLRLAKGRARRK